MYKEGLNIGIVISIFDENEALKDKFGKKSSKVVLKTLNPQFMESEEYKIKMDTQIFEYLKNN